MNEDSPAKGVTEVSSSLFRSGEYVETPDGVGRVSTHENGWVMVQFASGAEQSYEDTSVSDLRVASDFYPEFGTTLVDHRDHEKSVRVAAARKVASQGYEDGYQQAQQDAGREMASDDPEYWAAFQKGWSDGLVARPDHPNPARQTEELEATAPALPDGGGQGGPVFLTTAGGLWDFIRGDTAPTETWKGLGHNPSYDSCVWRRDSRCWFPKDLNTQMTNQMGATVWNGSDRGWCPRVTWDDQRKCPMWVAGPNDGGAPARWASDYVVGDRLT